MLSSYRKSAGALALALSVCAASAMAENRNVLIVDGAYFPALSHVQPGDQVVFTNNATGSHTAETPTTFSGQTLEEPAFEGAISFD